MKKYSILLLFVVFNNFAESQNRSSASFLGEYVSINKNNVVYLVTIQIDHFAIFLTDPNEHPKHEGDIFYRDNNYEGSWVISSKIIEATIKNMHEPYEVNLKVSFKIIDSTRLLVLRTFGVLNQGDTLFRTLKWVVFHNETINTWVYTFYRQPNHKKFTPTSDITDSIVLPILPVFSFFDSSDKITKQFIDTKLIHPLSKKYYKQK